MCYSHPVPDFRSVHVTKTTKSHGDKFEMLGSALTLPNAACPPFCAKSFDTSNSPQSRVITGLNRYFASQSYPLSINTRIARES